MATPNPPFDGYPDLTLPDRTDPPPPPPSPFKPMELPPRETLPVAGPASASFREGDTVLAPLEPDHLYAGTVLQIEQGQALIEYSDGRHEAWVFVGQLRPVELTIGQRVLCRRKPGRIHVPAQIRALSGASVQVEFSDGLDWTNISALRIPTVPDGPAAVPARALPARDFLRQVQPGQRVWAPWKSTVLFAGTVSELNDREAHIHFDDGDAGWVMLEQLQPLELASGLRVLGRWKMGTQYYPGTIAQVDDNRILIHYDESGAEWTTPAALALPTTAAGPDARPTKNASGARGIGWIILACLALVRLIFFLMR